MTNGSQPIHFVFEPMRKPNELYANSNRRRKNKREEKKTTLPISIVFTKSDSFIFIFFFGSALNILQAHACFLFSA